MSAKNLKQQRIDEWINIDEDALKYHTNQWHKPKQSTLAFQEFIGSTITKSKNIIDLGAGAGAATAYLANKYPSVNFVAYDYSLDLVEIGRKIKDNMQLKNLDFEQGDWFNLNLNKSFDGCVSLQTLSWLPDYKAPLVEIFQKIKPNFVALTSLFYEGDISCRIEITEHTRDNRQSFYNIYSLPAIARLCEENGYQLTKYTPFDIDIDIEKPKNLNLMGTYTENVIDKRTGDKKRIQISGPLLMNWYMVLIHKKSLC